jgi:hypothetical protein
VRQRHAEGLTRSYVMAVGARGGSRSGIKMSGCGFGVLLLSIRYSNVALHTLDHPHHPSPPRPSAPSLAHSSVGALGYGVAEQLRMKGRAECIPGSTDAKSCTLSPYDPARYNVRAEVSHQTVPPRPNARLRKWIRASRSFDSVTLWAR